MYGRVLPICLDHGLQAAPRLSLVRPHSCPYCTVSRSLRTIGGDKLLTQAPYLSIWFEKLVNDGNMFPVTFQFRKPHLAGQVSHVDLNNLNRLKAQPASHPPKNQTKKCIFFDSQMDLVSHKNQRVLCKRL